MPFNIPSPASRGGGFDPSILGNVFRDTMLTKMQSKLLIDRIIKEAELREKAAKEADKRKFTGEMIMRGGQLMTQPQNMEELPPDMQREYQEGSFSGPYGQRWQTPSAPAVVPEGFVQLPGGKLGEPNIVARPGYKPRTKEEALEMKRGKPTTLESLIAQNITPEEAKGILKEKWKKSGEKKTAIQKNVPYIAKLLDVSPKEAAKIVTQSKSKSPSEVYRTFLTSALRSSLQFDQAKEKADKAMEAYMATTKRTETEDPLGIL